MISRSIFALLPQYLSLRTSSTFWPTVHDLNLNGPVPVGCEKAYEPLDTNVPFTSSPLSASYCFSAFGLCIANDETTSDGKKVPDCFLSLMMTLYGPLAE